MLLQIEKSDEDDCQQAMNFSYEFENEQNFIRKLRIFEL